MAATRQNTLRHFACGCVSGVSVRRPRRRSLAEIYGQGAPGRGRLSVTLAWRLVGTNGISPTRAAPLIPSSESSSPHCHVHTPCRWTLFSDKQDARNHCCQVCLSGLKRPIELVRSLFLACPTQIFLYDSHLRWRFGHRQAMP